MNYILHIDYYDEDFVHMVYGAKTDCLLSKLDIKNRVHAKAMQYVNRLMQRQTDEYIPMSDDEKYFDFFGHKISLYHFGIDEDAVSHMLCRNRTPSLSFDDFFQEHNYSIETLDSYFVSTLPK